MSIAQICPQSKVFIAHILDKVNFLYMDKSLQFDDNHLASFKSRTIPFEKKTN